MKFHNFYSLIEEGLMKEQPTIHDYDNQLRQKGWKYIGAGAYGRVFGKEGKNYVLKVYKDQAYDAFLQFIEKNQNNPHFPKIKRQIVQSNDLNNFLGVVAIEKLKPVEDQSGRTWIDWLINSFSAILQRNMSTHNNFDYTLELFKEFHIGRNNWRTDKNPSKSIKRLDFLVENYLEELRSIFALFQWCKVNFKEAYFDFHLGNVMIRPSTNEIVITDPICAN